MAGYDRLLPGRKVVSEIISDGGSFVTGTTGWTSRFMVPRYNSWATPLPPSSSVRVMLPTPSTSSGAITITASSQLVAQPDYPRAVKIAATTSQVGTGNVIVTGTNQFGETVSDTISLGSGSSVIDGVVAFKTITSVVLPASTSMSTATAVGGPVITIGLSNIFGLDRSNVSATAIIRGVKNGTVESTAPILGAGSSSSFLAVAGATSVTRATAQFASAATSSAGALMEIYYFAADPTHA